MDSYRDFLARKHVRSESTGVRIKPEFLNPSLFDWQREVVAWELLRGRGGMYEDCGLGKSVQELAWADALIRGGHAKRILILCPLCVAPQFVGEAEKFAIETDVRVCREQSQVDSGITVANYESLHKFDVSAFDGVVADESGILKSYTGKIKNQLCGLFKNHRFKLAATATPAPNDRLELGNQAEFLSIMPSNMMIARWFINDGKQCGKYTLRTHAAKDFWRWMASWSVCLSTPADIGYDASAYQLPPLEVLEHITAVDVPDGWLFHPGGNVAATQVHTEKRAALREKAAVVAELVNRSNEPWAVWCETDYEADALKSSISDAVEVRGSQPVEKKEELITAFTVGQARAIITKPKIGGYGLNWQHCPNTTWFPSFSFEQYYQAIRRLYRFGQKRTVRVHLVMSESEQSINNAVNYKAAMHEEMHGEMARLMAGGMKEELFGNRKLTAFEPLEATRLPTWLTSKGV